MHYFGRIVNSDFETIFVAGKTLQNARKITLRVKLAALLRELAGFFFHSLLQSFLFGDALFRRILPHVLGFRAISGSLLVFSVHALGVPESVQVKLFANSPDLASRHRALCKVE